MVRIKQADQVVMKINKLIRLLCSRHTIQMPAASEESHFRDTA